TTVLIFLLISSDIWNAKFYFALDPPCIQISSLSLLDALPIYCCSISSGYAMTPRGRRLTPRWSRCAQRRSSRWRRYYGATAGLRSEEHTSELQSRENLVCRLLLEKKYATIMLPVYAFVRRFVL